MIIGIDLDGVIRDFVGGITHLYKLEFPEKPILPVTEYNLVKSFPAETQKTLWNWINQKAIVAQEFMKPYHGAAQFLAELKKQGHTTILITSQPTVKLKQSTMIWLTTHSVILKSLDTIVVGDFRQTAKTCLQINILLDDCTDNLELARKIGNTTPILMKRDWNNDWSGPKITEYTEFFSFLGD